MKILQLSKYYPPTFGGLEIVAEFFSRAAIDLGHEVTVLSVGKGPRNYQGRYGEEVLQSNEDLNVKSSPFSLKFLRHFYNILKNDPPAYIFVHLPNPFSHEAIKLFARIIKEKNIKVVGIYHSDIINQVTLRDAYNLYFLNSINFYDSFICSSPNLINTSPILSSVAKKVKVIPYCIDNMGVELPVRQRQFKGRFLTIGRMVPYKGFEFLIECFKHLPYELTIVGNGPLKNELTKMASPNIKFKGSVSEDEKFKMFAEHDALIVSSINRAEAFGMTIVEAFSVGLPVIASNIDTGVSYLVRENETGFKFEIKDQADLLSQLEKFARSPMLVERVARQGREFFEKNLSYEAFKQNLNLFFNSFH